MSIEVLVRESKGVQEEIMRFVDNKPTFTNDHVEKQFRMFGIYIPRDQRPNFANLITVHFPEEGQADEQFELFKKALKFEIGQRYSFRNYHWKILSEIDENSFEPNLISKN